MAKAKKASDDEETVFNFLSKENRPFSVQNIVDALQKHSMKKTAVDRSLMSLVEKGKVSKKEYGKAKIFIIRQDNIDVPADDDVAHLSTEIKTLSAELSDVTTRAEKLKAQLTALKEEYTLEEATRRNEELIRQLAEKGEKYNALGDGSKLITKDDKRKLEQIYYNVRSLWKKYKRLVTDIANQIGESTGKKNAQLFEDMCIETDEAANVKLSDFPEIQNPLKTRRMTSTIRALKRQRQK